MSIKYSIKIEDPKNHIVKVALEFTRDSAQKNITIFMPSWCPGSYLMREYARHLRTIKVSNKFGETIFFEQKAKGGWEINTDRLKVSKGSEQLLIEYEVYCHELTVRTAHIDESHAFLHGPAYLLGVRGMENHECEVSIEFPALWSKVSTGLKDISPNREKFLYLAKNYDELVDSPIEIGCHETDGFRIEGIDHNWASVGPVLPHKNDLKKDIKILFEHNIKLFGEIPYDNYTLITHFFPNCYGGLEHLNSTVCLYDGRKLANRKEYINFLSLIAHEHFHAWNVKRIRPVELGPFEYTEENYTTMLWLAEGLTSFCDDLTVYQTGLCSLEEYLEVLKTNLNRYLGIPGKKYHSLEQSSFNAWIKLYRPDENSQNSSISYYLKGGLVFFALNSLLYEKGTHTGELLKKLWAFYKKRPEKGLNTQEVLQLIGEISDAKTSQAFETMISTTEDLDLEFMLKQVGVGVEWEVSEKAYLGVVFDFDGNRVLIKQVLLDSPAYKTGLNAGDEIIALNGTRVLKSDVSSWGETLEIDQLYQLTVSRLGQIIEVDLIPGKTPREVKSLSIKDEKKVKEALLWKV